MKNLLFALAITACTATTTVTPIVPDPPPPVVVTPPPVVVTPPPVVVTPPPVVVPPVVVTPPPVVTPPVVVTGPVPVKDASCANLNLPKYPVDDKGWTILPSVNQPGRRVIYVSASNAGKVNTASVFYVTTPEAGAALLRSSAPDSLLFNRGETFHPKAGFAIPGSTASGGPTMDQAKVIGAYGSGPRPILSNTAGGSGLTFANSTVTNLIVSDLDLRQTVTGGNGIYLTPRHAENVLFENVRVANFSDNVVTEPACPTCTLTNIQFHRDEILHACGAFRSQGLFAQGVTGLSITESFMDQNGLQDCKNDNSASPQAQNLYIYGDVACFKLKDSVVSRALGAGLEARSGGEITGNLFLNSNTTINFGAVLGGEVESKGVPYGVSGSIVGNVIYTPSTGIQLANMTAGSVLNNIMVGTPGSHFQPISTLSMGIGIHGADVENNLFYNAEYGIGINGSSVVPLIVKNDGVNDVITAASHASWKGTVMSTLPQFLNVPIFQYQTSVLLYNVPTAQGLELNGGDQYDVATSKLLYSSGHTGLLVPPGAAPRTFGGQNVFAKNIWQGVWSGVPLQFWWGDPAIFARGVSLHDNIWNCTVAAKPCPKDFMARAKPLTYANPSFVYPDSLYAAMALQSREAWNTSILAPVLVKQAQAAFAVK